MQNKQSQTVCLNRNLTQKLLLNQPIKSLINLGLAYSYELK